MELTVASMNRVRVTWTVEYETTFQPEGEDGVDIAIERLMDICPGDAVMGDEWEQTMHAVGWCVEHPEWGDMRMGSLQGAK